MTLDYTYKMKYNAIIKSGITGIFLTLNYIYLPESMLQNSVYSIIPFCEIYLYIILSKMCSCFCTMALCFLIVPCVLSLFSTKMCVIYTNDSEKQGKIVIVLLIQNS
jgi:hypothetical protein